MKHPKYGIIGCGNIAKFHFKGLAKAGAEIIHVADINPEAAKLYAKNPLIKFSSDYRAVIEDPDVTVVSVLTGGKTHRDICLAALYAGKDVICEKTMSDNAQEAHELVHAVRKTGKLFFTSYMKRFYPAVQKAKELIPLLGHIFSAQVRSYQAWGNFYNDTSEGVLKDVVANYGGAIIKCAGSHMLDLTHYMLGRPENLYASIDSFPGTDFDRKATALLEYSNGCVVSFEAAAHPLLRVGYERNGWDECMQINGVQGRLDLYTVTWDQSEKNGALLAYYDNKMKTATEYRFAPMIPFDMEMEYFHHCLTDRIQGNPDVLDGFNVDVIIQAMQESSENKAQIKIDWKGL